MSQYFSIVKAITSASNQKKFLGLEDKLNNIELRIIRDCFSLEQSNEYDNYYIIKVNIKKIKFITDNNVDIRIRKRITDFIDINTERGYLFEVYYKTELSRHKFENLNTLLKNIKKVGECLGSLILSSIMIKTRS